MPWSEQVIHREFAALFRRKDTLDKFLVATQCVGPLVVDSWDVVDLKLDTRNGGLAYCDLDKAAKGMCCQPSRDGCACGDVVRALPQ